MKCAVSREDELAHDGWIKRNTYDEPRLSEIVEFYRELGFEVHLEPFRPQDSPECTECMLQDCERFKTVYTRLAHEIAP